MIPELVKIYQNRRYILEESKKHFSNSSSQIIKIGCELEFFLLEKNRRIVEDQELLRSFIILLKEKLSENFPLIYEVEKERGASQIEIKTKFTPNLSEISDTIDKAKVFTQELAQKNNLFADFSSQPFLNDCGNALQFNISLHNQEDKNLFSNKDFLNQAAKKLLAATNFMMIFLAPKESDYLRFDSLLNQNLFKSGKFTAPTNLSFGSNNRSCAIRFAKGESGTRMEYRIASADADIFLIIAAILIVIAKENEAENFDEIFGNAFSEQYQLKNFCRNLKESETAFFGDSNFIQAWFLS
jgi:glutamine synthetase